jgi:predicted acylesterase/phospholipase RssA/tetratricopeptide (TPR) repeat protein/ankyrin repeat protein
VSQGVCRLLSRAYTGCSTFCQVNHSQVGFARLKQLHFFSAIQTPRPLNHTFKQLEPSQKVGHPWFVFLAIAIAAATLIKRTEAEEEPLFWEELEQIAFVVGMDLPKDDFKKASYRCFHAIFEAVIEGNWSLVNQIPDTTLSKLTDVWGQTLLIAAAGEGNKPAVETLIKRKIALEKTDSEGNTPLHAAVKNGFSHLVPLLSDYYIKACNHQGKNAHHLAIEQGHLATLRALINKKTQSEPFKEGNLTFSLLALCVRHSRKDCLDFLLKQYGYQINEQTPKFTTLLHVAIHFGQFSMLKHLIGHSQASPLLQQCDDQGRNPLALAAYIGDLEAVEFLYHKVADPKNHAWTVAHWAVEGRQGEVLKLLAYLGANLEQKVGEKRPENLLDGDTSFEATTIRNILNGLLENRFKINHSPLDYHSEPPENIVLKGGGPRGFAYLEALRTLKEKQALDAVRRTAGTSAGAITAAIFALDPDLKDIEALEKLDLMQFLDPIPGKEPLLKGMLKAKDKQGKLSKILNGSFEVAKEAWNPLKFYNAFSQLEGICEGEVLRDWIEKEIHRRTGKEHCTFGELRQEIQKGGKRLLHLHIYATRLEANPDKKILHFSSEDPEWDDIIISDAIRASMSIPGVYKPYIVRSKTRSNTLVPRTDIGPCVDGGLIKNFPLDAFDHSADSYYSSFNRKTLGLCLKDVEEPTRKSPPVNGILDIVKACAAVYWASEEIYLATEENRHRTIEIPIKGVGLCDFDLTPTQKANLLKSGRESIESSVFAQRRQEPDFLIHTKANNIATTLPTFTGRKEEMRVLETIVSQTPSSSQSIVRCIHGSGGMGKTELTRTFANKYKNDFSITWFINSESPETRTQSYRELAKKLNITFFENSTPDQIERTVHEFLENHSYDKPWLLVYDNAEERPNLPKGGYVLITARNRAVWANEHERIPLTEMPLSDSIQLLTQITQTKSPCMSELARELGNFPLALNQAAHYIKNANCAVEEYLIAFKKNPLKGMKTDERYEKTLQNVWQMTLQKLGEKNPKALAWLQICAHLNPDDLPQEWIADWLKLQPDSGDWDKMEITSELLDWSLIRPKDQGYSMHRLMQKLIRETAPHKYEEAFKIFILQGKDNRKDWKKAHWEITDQARAEKWAMQGLYLEQSQLFKSMEKKLQLDAHVMIIIIFFTLGRVNESEQHINRLIKLLNELNSHQDLAKELASIHSALGLCLALLWRNEEAMVYTLKALAYQKEALLPDDPALADTYHFTGIILGNQGRHKEALEFEDKSLEIIEKKLSPDPLDIADCYHFKGLILKNLERNQEALIFLHRSLDLRIKILSETHPLILNLYQDIALCLSDLKRYKEALDYSQKALSFNKQTLPPNHPDLARSYLNIADILSNMDRDQEALAYSSQGLDIYKKTLPANHPALESAYFKTAVYFGSLGQYEEALKHLQKSLTIRAFSRANPDDEICLALFIEMLALQTDAQIFKEAQQEVLSLYTKRLGENHPLIQQLKNAKPRKRGCIIS